MLEMVIFAAIFAGVFAIVNLVVDLIKFKVFTSKRFLKKNSEKVFEISMELTEKYLEKMDI